MRPKREVPVALLFAGESGHSGCPGEVPREVQAVLPVLRRGCSGLCGARGELTPHTENHRGAAQTGTPGARGQRREE